ncbi:MAG: GAF domain-containing protein, partial [Candidatus Hydrogenedentota bacterium]
AAPDADAISRHAAREGKPILVRNLSQDKRFTAPGQANRYTTDTALSAPILYGGKVLGVLNVNNKSGSRPLDEDDKDFFMTVAYHLGTCLHGALERQRRERADQRFRHLATRAPVPMMGFDLEGRVWLWNQALQQLTGWSASDVLGKPILECFFPSEERAGSPAEWVAKIRKGQTVEKQEVTLTNAQGLPQIVQYNVFPVEEGSLGVWVGVNLTAEREAQHSAERRASEINATQKVLTDLISQQEQEEMLHRLAIWMAHVLSCKRSVVCVRETAGEALKCRAMHGFAEEDGVSPEAPPFRTLFEHILNAPGPLCANQAGDLPEPMSNVFHTVHNAAGAPLRIRGEVVGILAVFDRKQGAFSEHDESLLSDMANVASVALEVARAQSERLHNEHLRTAVAMAVSFNHEVNNPLQTILGSVELIATEHGLPGEVRAALDSISEAVERISTVNTKLREAIDKSAFRTYPSGLPMLDIPPPGEENNDAAP